MRNSDDRRASGGTPWRAENAASDAALVVVITISFVLAVKPPTIGPAKLAWSPSIGSTPTMAAAAIPSGIAAAVRGAAAIAERLRVPRRGLIPVHHLRNLDTTWLAPSLLGSVVRSLAGELLSP